ncbi:MAG: Stk1 family PASTA domain-containing Ser/Thr kinase [Acidimicrobiia bacterium]
MEDRVLSDRYRIVRHLARGGMADVFEAEDTLLNRSVAVKVLHANFASDEAFVTRFRREAQAAANLSHPNIVAIYDWGHDNGTYFMVMELIKGKTLRDVLKSGSVILPRRAAEIAAGTAAALSVAHQHGVYHRDVKPGNIMLTPDGAVKVTDFGIARALDDSEELTRTGAVIGTATYFSPEQAQGLPADERSDVYSLGVVLYEMLAGKPPFSGESPVAVAYQHVSESATPPEQVNPDAPIELAAIASHAMKKRPEDRYQTAEDMRSDLVRYLRGSEPLAAGAVSAAAATAMIPPPAGMPAGSHPAAATTSGTMMFDEAVEERSQTGYWAAVGGLVVILFLGVWLLINLLSNDGATAATVEVPNLVDMPADQAFEELQRLELKLRSREETSDTIAVGRVTRTDPPAGSSIAVGEFVTVWVSLGQEEFGVPNVLNENVDIARARIRDQGFEVGNITYQPTDDIDENIVINQSPPGGTTAPPGTKVDLVVSAGPAAIEIPDVAGKSPETAVLELAREGFTNIETQHDFSPEVPEGFVIETNPAAGQVVPKEATIIVIVSDGPEPVSVPDLVGKTEGAARSQLNGLGLQLVVSTETVEVPLGSGLVGKVASQDIPVGTEVEVGSSITVKLGIVRKVEVPDLFQMTVEQAETAAGAVGLTIDISVEDPPESTPDSTLNGKVASQDPLAHEMVDEGSIIIVVLYQWDGTTTTTTTMP